MYTPSTRALARCLCWAVVASTFAFGMAQAAGRDDIEALRRARDDEMSWST